MQVVGRGKGKRGRGRGRGGRILGGGRGKTPFLFEKGEGRGEAALSATMLQPKCRNTTTLTGLLRKKA